MSKSFILGNGSLTIGLDLSGQVYDLYFPYVGLENHTGGPFVHKIGFFVDGQFSWIDDGSWEMNFLPTINESKYIARNSKLQITVEFNSVVYNEKNIFLRELKIINNSDRKRVVKTFFNQQLEIYESYRGDTAYYYPNNNTIVHYKGRRVFIINAQCKEDNKYFSEYSVGLFGIEGKQGTFKDAEDGVLSKNPIEHGLVDSVIGIETEVEANLHKTVYYWMCIDKIMAEAEKLNTYVILKTPAYLIESSNDYWQAWVSKNDYDFRDLGEEVESLFLNSLKIMRTHTDNTGAIVASIDTDLLKYGRDTYSYVWPRDSAFTVIAYSKAGYTDLNNKIFDFFNEVIRPEGYLMHKYRSDRSMGSSWHPWIYKDSFELPIQIDETALIIVALWEDYEATKDIEYIEQIYNSLIKKITEFLITRINVDTGLVYPSYDLWEEKFCTSTFTSATVFAALKAASKFAKLFGKKDKSDLYWSYAKKVKEGILTHLYSNDSGNFYKAIYFKEHSTGGEMIKDETLDMSSLYAVFKFGVVHSDDEKITRMKANVEEKLSCNNLIGGFPRYENDNYFKVTDTVSGNPWIITTLWMAQLEISRATKKEDLNIAKNYVNWAVKRSTSTGLLPEQVNPLTGDPLSACPLTWSHAEFVITVLNYIHKDIELTTVNQ